MSTDPPPAWQFGLVAYTPLLTGSLSVLGSSLIIRSVLGPGRQEKLGKPHLRLLLAMSCYDLLYSLPKALTFLLAPAGYGVPGAQGNLTTCRMQGFFIQLAHATGSYNSLLSLYYWLIICRGMRIETWNRFEAFIHLLIFVVFFGLASVGVAIKLFNPAFAWCYIASYPPGCGTEAPGSVPCERFPPHQLGFLYEVFAQMFIQFYFIVVIFTNAAIWWKVHVQEKKIQKYTNHTASDLTQSNSQTQSETQPQSSSLQLDNNNNCGRTTTSKTTRERSVAVQTLLYTGAFCLSWTGATVFHLVTWIKAGDVNPFGAAFVLAIFGPLQGFFNAIIYGRPTYLRVRKKFPNLTRYQAVKRVFFTSDPMTSPSTASVP